MPKDKKPIITNDPNDPRLKAYNDSLNAYNDNIMYFKEYKKLVDNAKTREEIIKGKDLLESKYPISNKIKPIKISKKFEGPVLSKRDDLKYTAHYNSIYKKPIQPVILEKEENFEQIPLKQFTSNNNEELKLMNNKSVKLDNEYTHQIETTPNYKVKYTKDNTGKIVNTKYYNFDNKEIEINNIEKKYTNGGQNVADFLGNWVKAGADSTLGAFGMSNIIQDDAYKGNSAKGFIKASNVMGNVAKTALPFALQAVGVPAAATTAGLGILDNFNPEANNQNNNTMVNKINPLRSSMFANGGMNSMPNAEVEKEENTIAPNGEFTQYNGPSHEQGGIKTTLDNGEIVFSDRLKPKGSKKTFAELNKPFNTNKEDELLEDKKVSNLKRITADLMKQAKLKQSANLFKEQEALKQERINKYAGKIGYKFTNGGQYNFLQEMPEEDLSQDFQESLGKRQYADLMSRAGQTSHWDLPGQNNQENPSNGINPIYLNAAKQLGLGLAQNAGNIYNLKRSNTVDTETYNRVNPTLLDANPALQYNDMQGRMAGENIRNSSNGNSSTYIQNRKDLAINQMMANANIRMDYDNQNAGIKNNAQMYNARVGDRETIANLQNKAQARNLKGDAISNIGQNIMGQYKDSLLTKENTNYNNQMGKSQSDYLKILMARYPEISKDKELSGLFK